MSRYRLRWQIGGGGMGIVYAADRVLPSGEVQQVACKVMRDDLLKAANGQALFHREAAVGLMIGHRHPNLVTTYDLLRGSDGCEYLIMEYVAGCSLATLIESYGRLPYDVTRQILVDVAAGLGSAHEQEVLHRDLSPCNVLVGIDGVARISDFGLAKHAPGGVTDQSQMTLKMAYASPEALYGDRVSVCADLYSLGATLWEMLCGDAPFGKLGGVGHVMERMRAWDVVPLPDDVPRDLAALAGGWVQRAPEARCPVTAQGALVSLRQIVDVAAHTARADGSDSAAREAMAEMAGALHERDGKRRARRAAHCWEPSADFIDAVSVVECEHLVSSAPGAGKLSTVEAEPPGPALPAEAELASYGAERPAARRKGERKLGTPTVEAPAPSEPSAADAAAFARLSKRDRAARWSFVGTAMIIGIVVIGIRSDVSPRAPVDGPGPGPGSGLPDMAAEPATAAADMPAEAATAAADIAAEPATASADMPAEAAAEAEAASVDGASGGLANGTSSAPASASVGARDLAGIAARRQGRGAARDVRHAEHLPALEAYEGAAAAAAASVAAGRWYTVPVVNDLNAVMRILYGPNGP